MIRLFEMFAGYGGASFALKKAGIDFECVGYSEIDKYAVECYEQNHKGKNYGDCTKINPEDIPDFDLLTGGFPCQAFSVAGKGLGELDTRGTLFNEIIRIAEVKKPKYMLLENVKGLTTKKHKATFEKILSELNRIGYYVEWKVLNSKEYGIPQNRERVFFVCRRFDVVGDIDTYENSIFKFPEKEELKIFLKDILEEEVDEKYYLSSERVNQLLLNINPLSKKNHVHGCITEAIGRSGSSSEFKQSLKKVNESIINREGHKIAIPVITPDRVNKRQNGRRFKTDGEPMFTLNTQDRHGILQINNPKHSNNRVYSAEGCSPTLRDMSAGGNRQPFVANENLIIRKLTPTECFRLMGFLDDEINLDGLSNTQRYKLAGNGWCIVTVSKIFKEMFK